MMYPMLDHRLSPDALALKLLVENALETGILMPGHRKLVI